MKHNHRNQSVNIQDTLQRAKTRLATRSLHNQNPIDKTFLTTTIQHNHYQYIDDNNVDITPSEYELDDLV